MPKKRKRGRPKKHQPEKRKRGRPKKHQPEKLTKADPLFFVKLGKLGGRSTKKNHDADYFSKIAVISHQRRRERAAEAAGN